MPVGSARLSLYAFLARFLPWASADAQAALAQCKFYEIILDAFERYPHANLLHAHIAALVSCALRDGAQPAAPTSPATTPAAAAPAAAPEPSLVTSLLVDGRLAQRLAALAASDAVATQGVVLDGCAPVSRSPLLGHVLTLGNALVAAEARDDGVRAALAGLGEWRAFVQGALAVANANEKTMLGGTVRAAAARWARASMRRERESHDMRRQMRTHARTHAHARTPAQSPGLAFRQPAAVSIGTQAFARPHSAWPLSWRF
jgi:hypothetical protein